MKSEFVSFQKHASTLEEILSLKQHQENLQIKFKEVSNFTMIVFFLFFFVIIIIITKT